MQLTYEPAADVAYIRLTQIGDGAAVTQRTVEVPGGGCIVLDFDADARLLGIEILGAEAILGEGILNGLGVERI